MKILTSIVILISFGTLIKCEYIHSVKKSPISKLNFNFYEQFFTIIIIKKKTKKLEF